jgi:hemolysin activation/secretion protein
VDAGTFAATSARLSHPGGLRWNLAAAVVGGADRVTGRVYGDLRRDGGDQAGASLRLAAGVATRPAPPQSQFRLGGLATVRGFDYAERRGQAFWAAQLDIAPFGGRLRPVAFVDAGQAARVADLFSSGALVGAGAGLSLFGGVLRLDLSHPLTTDTGGKVRFDIVVRAMR